MKKFFLWAILIGTVTPLMLAASAQAQSGSIVANIHQPFIAGGKAFPAGTYKIFPGPVLSAPSLVLREQETGTLVFLLPNGHEQALTDQVGMKLTRSGDSYYLSQVVTDLGIYTFPVPRTLAQTAKVKGSDAMAASGSD